MTQVGSVALKYAAKGAREVQRQDRNVRNSIKETARTARQESGTIRRWMERHRTALLAIGAATAGLLTALIRQSPALNAQMAGVRLGFSLLAMTIGQDVAPALSGLSDTVLGLADAYRDLDPAIRGPISAFVFWGTVLTLVVALLGTLATYITTVILPGLKTLGAYITATIIPALRRFASVLIAYVVAGLRRLATFITATIIPALRRFAAVIITSVVAGLRRLAAIITATVIPALRRFALAITTLAIASLRTMAATIATTVIPALGSVVAFLTNPVTLAIVGIVAAIAALFLAWETNFLGIRDIVADTAGWIEAQLGALGGALANFANSVASHSARVILEFNSIVNRIQSSIAGLISAAAGWGVDLIDEFIGGIVSMAEDLWSRVEGIIGGIKDLISFDMAANDRMARRWGSDLVDEFATGMERNTQRLQRATPQGGAIQPRPTPPAAAAGGGGGANVTVVMEPGAVALQGTGAQRIDEGRMAEQVGDDLFRRFQQR